MHGSSPRSGDRDHLLVAAAALLAPLAYAGYFTAIQQATTTASLRFGVVNPVSYAIDVTMVIAAGALTAWAWRRDHRPTAVVLVVSVAALLVPSEAPHPFLGATSWFVTIGLVLAGTVLLVEHRDHVGNRELAIATAAGLAHGVVGWAIWTVGSNIGMPAAVSAFESGLNALVLIGLGSAAAFLWQRSRLRTPAVVIAVWATVSLTWTAVVVTMDPGMGTPLLFASIRGLPLHLYFNTMGYLGWLMVMVGGLEAIARTVRRSPGRPHQNHTPDH